MQQLTDIVDEHDLEADMNDLEAFKFTCSFPDDFATHSVPKSLKHLVSMLLYMKSVLQTDKKAYFNWS